MSDKYFIDTNIFVYALLESEPIKKRRANELIENAIECGLGVVSYQVAHEFLNVAFRAPNLMPAATAEAFLSIVFRPLLHAPPSVELYSEALRIRGRYEFGWFDSMIVAAAMESGCRTLYTEDMQHGMKIGRMRIVDPFRAS
jgi:predicted nucleic acid-binding protein